MVFGNLETPLVANASRAGKDFAASPTAARCLQEAGFTLLNLANNHVRDFGGKGLAETLRHVEGSGLTSVGAGGDDDLARARVVTEASGLSLGWLACARTLQAQKGPGARFWELDPEALLAAVRRARRGVDALAVSIHTGYMFLDLPHPDHRTLALELAAAGADLVLMHHAHVIQGLEMVPGSGGRESLVAYNLGNFLFDWKEGATPVDLMEEEQRQALCLEVELDADGVAAVNALPARISEDARRVGWATDEDGRHILDRLERVSGALEGDFAALFRQQRAERNAGLTFDTIAGRLKAGDFAWLLRALPRARPAHLRMLFAWLRRRASPGGAP